MAHAVSATLVARPGAQAVAARRPSSPPSQQLSRPPPPPQGMAALLPLLSRSTTSPPPRAMAILIGIKEKKETSACLLPRYPDPGPPQFCRGPRPPPALGAGGGRGQRPGVALGAIFPQLNSAGIGNVAQLPHDWPGCHHSPKWVHDQYRDHAWGDCQLHQFDINPPAVVAPSPPPPLPPPAPPLSLLGRMLRGTAAMPRQSSMPIKLGMDTSRTTTTSALWVGDGLEVKVAAADPMTPAARYRFRRVRPYRPTTAWDNAAATRPPQLPPFSITSSHRTLMLH
jgi:hypothetical protein